MTFPLDARGLNLVAIYPTNVNSVGCRLCLQCNVRCRFFLVPTPMQILFPILPLAFLPVALFSVAVYTVIISVTSLRAGAASELDGHPSLSSTYIYDAACSDVDVTDGDVALIISFCTSMVLP